MGNYRDIPLISDSSLIYSGIAYWPGIASKILARFYWFMVLTDAFSLLTYHVQAWWYSQSQWYWYNAHFPNNIQHYLEYTSIRLMFTSNKSKPAIQKVLHIPLNLYVNLKVKVLWAPLGNFKLKKIILWIISSATNNILVLLALFNVLPCLNSNTLFSKIRFHCIPWSTICP